MQRASFWALVDLIKDRVFKTKTTHGRKQAPVEHQLMNDFCQGHGMAGLYKKGIESHPFSEG